MNRILHQTEEYTTLDLSDANNTFGYTILNTSDYTIVNTYNWFINTLTSGYKRVVAYKCLPKKYSNIIILSRIVMNCPNNLQVDHINGNTLINTRFNLRVCSSKDNQRNIISSNQKINKYKGVYPARKRFMSRIKYNGKAIYLGLYQTELEAAIVYNNAATILFGEFANLNKIS